MKNKTIIYTESWIICRVYYIGQTDITRYILYIVSGNKMFEVLFMYILVYIPIQPNDIKGIFLGLTEV